MVLVRVTQVRVVGVLLLNLKKVQKNYMDIAFNEIELNLMRNIKKVFDPKNIMNPSKIF